MLRWLPTYLAAVIGLNNIVPDCHRLMQLHAAFLQGLCFFPDVRLMPQLLVSVQELPPAFLAEKHQTTAKRLI